MFFLYFYQWCFFTSVFFLFIPVSILSLFLPVLFLCVVHCSSLVEHLSLHFEMFFLLPKNTLFHKGVNAQGATTRATSDKIVACRVASNYPFAKLMEIAESVPTGRVRQVTKFFKRQNFRFL